jgi:hypothetical protein
VSFTLSPLLRRILALGILAVVVVLAWSLAVWPLLELSLDRRADIDALAAQAGHFEAMIARKPALERKAHALRQDVSAAGGFWNGPSGAAVAAVIQDRLREAVTAGGGRVKSTSFDREANERGFRKIVVQFSIEGTLDTLQKTLAAVERRTPALFVDGFTVEAAETGTAPDRAPVLDFDLSVAGYMRGSG